MEQTDLFNITIERQSFTQDVTCGKVYINDVYFGESLESTFKGLNDQMDIAHIVKESAISATAIPTGRYRVAMDLYSYDFGNEKEWRNLTGGYVPQIMGIPGFKTVYICSYSDRSKWKDSIVIEQLYQASSRSISQKYRDFFNLLKTAHREGKEIWITIK